VGNINPETVIALTQKMIHLHSEPGDERKVAEFLYDELPILGFDRVWVDDIGNVVGEIHGNQPGPTLLLDGHTDTVGIAPGVPWSQDPFGGEIIGDRLYGRGASDMKGALAAMVVAASVVDREKLAGRVVISASVMEEVLEGIALQQVMETIQPDFVIIGEASDLKIVHGSRGRAEVLLESTGRPTHSSTPFYGINAIEAILPALQTIQQMTLPSHPFVGPAIMVLTEIISKPYPGQSVVPSRCLATFDRRLIPGETREDVLRPLSTLPTIPGAKLNVTLSRGEYQTYTGFALSMEKWYPAWVLERGHPLVVAATNGLRNAGLPVDYAAYRFCTNAAYSIGVAQIPTIGFGPSTDALAHIADEYIEIDQLIKAAEGYRAIIEGILS